MEGPLALSPHTFQAALCRGDINTLKASVWGPLLAYSSVTVLPEKGRLGSSRKAK